MCVVAGIVGAGALGAAGSIVGGSEQAGAAKNATNAQEGMFNTQVQNLAPFRQGGAEAMGGLDYLEGVGPQSGGPAGGGGYGSLNTPFTADYMKQYSPAYQFQLQQGQQGVLNQDAASQGSLSGASLKDLLSFNQNYANTAFNNAFNQYQTQNQNVYNRLSGLANIGEGAAANTATGASQFGQSIGSSMTNQGTALGAATVGASNSLGSLGGLPWLLANQSNASTLQGINQSANSEVDPGNFGYTGDVPGITS